MLFKVLLCLFSGCGMLHIFPRRRGVSGSSLLCWAFWVSLFVVVNNSVVMVCVKALLRWPPAWAIHMSPGDSCHLYPGLCLMPAALLLALKGFLFTVACCVLHYTWCSDPSYPRTAFLPGHPLAPWVLFLSLSLLFNGRIRGTWKLPDQELNVSRNCSNARSLQPTAPGWASHLCLPGDLRHCSQIPNLLCHIWNSPPNVNIYYIGFIILITSLFFSLAYLT